MSDPSTWPTTPPTEPGFYWAFHPLTSPQASVVYVKARDGELYVCLPGEDASQPISGRNIIPECQWASKMRWRPGRVEP